MQTKREAFEKPKAWQKVAGWSERSADHRYVKRESEVAENLSRKMKKKKPTFRLFGVRCPQCGSLDTKIDKTSVENLRLAFLQFVLIWFGIGGARFDGVCRTCGHKFSRH